jgi:hypothetical protein
MFSAPIIARIHFIFNFGTSITEVLCILQYYTFSLEKENMFEEV